MRSLNTGFDEMCSIVSDFDFDVFGVTETWLRPNTPSHYYQIPGYALLRSDRKTNEVGGGVAIYIKDQFVFEQRFFSDDVAPGIEYLCVVVKWKGQSLGICVVYRPSYVRYTRLSALFHSLFVDLAVEVGSVIYLGDNNIDLASNNSGESKFLRRLLKESNAVQIVNEPTRITASSATLLDHIIVDRSVEVKRIGVIDAPELTDNRGIAITDHKLVCCEIKCPEEKKGPCFITYRDYSKFDLAKAIDSMTKVNWEAAKDQVDVNDIESCITLNIKKIFDEHAPIVCKRVSKPKAPWRNEEIRNVTKAKNKHRNKYWKTKSQTDWNKYKVVRNKLNNLIRAAKKDYFSNKLSSTGSAKEFWDCLRKNNVVGSRKNDCLVDLDVDNVNEYFVNMGFTGNVEDYLIEFFNKNRLNAEVNEFTFEAVTENEVKRAMNEIKSRAVGIDNISIQMIKSASPYAIGAITHLINRVLTTQTFPLNWKKSIVLPLPKVPNPQNVEQFRPISILPAMSKIVEKIAVKQISSFVNEASILPNLQSGFRSNYSTCTALANLFSDMIEAKDKGRASSLVLLDFSQAFDSINHQMLLAKMNYFGFSQAVIGWVRSYLADRLQVTRLGSEISGPLSRLRGVPQGSCLGPVLFNLYTADFPSCVESCKAHIYADDCQLHLSYEPKEAVQAIDRINSDLQSIARWSAGNGLKLNIGKCTVLHVAPQDLLQALSDDGVGVRLGTESLTICDSVKTLGVVLDKDLTFSDHVTQSIQRALGRLRGMYRFRDLLPEPAKLQLAQALVLSVFQYCYPAYGNSISREDKGRIQRLQNAVLRFSFNLKLSDHVSPFREAANMLLMEDICRIMTCCLVQKVLIRKEPQYLCERLSFRREVANRPTRHGGRLHFPRVRLEVGRRGFSYFGPAMYNELPDSVKNCTSTKCFRRKMKEWLV
jgi:hypothetical protein